MTSRTPWAFTPLALALALAAGGSDDGGQTNALAVDTNPYSCTTASSSGTPIVVGSGDPGDPAAPEQASGYRLGYKAKYSSKYMVVANTPLATKAGCDVLKAGGSAADAAVAVQAVLGLVEPQSSTVAGSAFMLYYDAASKKVQAYDGRETAPAAANGHYLVRQDQADPDSPTPVPSARRGGPIDRRAGRDAHAGAGARRPRQAEVEPVVRRRHRAGRKGLPGAAAAGQRHRRQRRQPGAGRQRHADLLQRRRHAARGAPSGSA